MDLCNNCPEGILLVDKPAGKTSFSLVAVLRRLLKIKKIGHAGTLDPFATGVMVMLIGRSATKLSDSFLNCDKEYMATVRLGISTDTFDTEGVVTNTSDKIPIQEEIHEALKKFQGTILQTPPMFSAKKIDGQKLYDLARKGIEVERKPVEVTLETTFINYNYPFLEIAVKCSKGTYIRSIADDLGKHLGCYAHLTALRRTRSGEYTIDACIDGASLFDNSYDKEFLAKKIFI